ncbi:MAG TPA: sulfatase, partial [Bryobacteraceae bacterium]|nr:sulfatase [Bryobacteraceae bacterium]
MNRRQFVTQTIVGACASALPAAAARSKPNIVIIFLDDSGILDYPPYGRPEYPAPNVSRLASQGCTFSNFYV